MAERRRVDLQRVMTRISILVARNCFAPISEMWREAPQLWPSEAGVNLDRIKSPRRLNDAPADLRRCSDAQFRDARGQGRPARQVQTG